MKLITKQQIAKYVNLSENIADLNIDSLINDAIEFDTVNVFPRELLVAIAIKFNTKQWSKNTTYAIGDVTLFDTYFTAVAENTDSEPPSADWKVNELMNFYLEYLQPFIAYSFYYRFIAYHGAAITPSGIKETVDETMQIISDKRRGEMLGDIKNKINVWTARVSKKLSEVNGTFDGVKYNVECKMPKSKLRIWSIGSNGNNI